VIEEDLTVLVEGRTGITWFLGTVEGTVAGTPFAAPTALHPHLDRSTTTITAGALSPPRQPGANRHEALSTL
jgi:hypothetical protein